MNSIDINPSRIQTIEINRFEGTLIDLETTGLPYITKNCEIVTLGYYSQSKVIVTQRLSMKKEPFYEDLDEELDKLPKPFYAYNASFEKAVLCQELGVDFNIVDIMLPWKELAERKGLKWPKVGELISEPTSYFNPAVVDGSSIPRLWENYLKTGRFDFLNAIVSHCQSDVARELLLMTYQSIMNNEYCGRSQHFPSQSNFIRVTD